MAILNCGHALIGEMLDGKWKMPLWWFINQGFQRPSGLQPKISDASRRVLNLQLKGLENHKLVGKVIYAFVLPKAACYLTDFGKSLIAVIGAIGRWGDRHDQR